MLCDPLLYVRGVLYCGLNGLKTDPPCVITSFGYKTKPFYYSVRSCYDPYAQGARRLGAGASLTVPWFAPLARLRPVLGFYAIYCVCARFIGQGCNF
jgi:hypothetical protein